MVFKKLRIMLHLNKITKLTLEITSFCNLHCPQCPRYTEEGFLSLEKQDHLNFYNFSKNFDLKKLPNLKEVKIEGDYGDALMHPELDKFLSFFESIDHILLYTNGSIRNSKWWGAAAKKYKNLTVVFSIDGLKDTNHIYRINSDWKKIMQNCTSFIKNGGNASWKYIVFKHNQHQIEMANELAKNLGFKNFFTHYSDRNFYGTRKWPVKIDGKYQFDLEISDYKDPTRMKPNDAVEKMNAEFPITCKFLKNGQIDINHTGHILPCYMTSGVTWKKGISPQLFRRTIGDIDSIDITKNNIESIAKSDFYVKNLSESLKKEETAHPICVANCSGCSV